MTAELIHRLHFAFTITFHYLFPQLTMGLGLLIVVLKTVALKTGSEQWDKASISSSVSLQAFPWNSSSVPTGLVSHGSQEA